MRKILRNVYDPVHTTVQLLPVGGSESQIYDAGSSEFIPDRQLTPLVILPVINVSDPSGLIVSGNKNAELTDIRWYENEVSEANNISNDNALYVIDRASSNNSRGKITVKKNVSDETPLTLIFTAKYLDTRTNMLVPVESSIRLYTTAVAEGALHLITAYPTGKALYPTAGTTTMKLEAVLKRGDASIFNTVYWWQKNVNGSWQVVTNTDGVSGAETSEITLPASAIGKCSGFRCAASETPDGVRPATIPTNALTADFVLTTRYEKYEYEIITPGGGNISPSLKNIPVSVRITTASGTISSPHNYYTIKWYNTSGTLFGQGEAITIPGSMFASGEFAFDVEITEGGSDVVINPPLDPDDSAEWYAESDGKGYFSINGVVPLSMLVPGTKMRELEFDYTPITTWYFEPLFYVKGIDGAVSVLDGTVMQGVIMVVVQRKGMPAKGYVYVCPVTGRRKLNLKYRLNGDAFELELKVNDTLLETGDIADNPDLVLPAIPADGIGGLLVSCADGSDLITGTGGPKLYSFKSYTDSGVVVNNFDFSGSTVEEKLKNKSTNAFKATLTPVNIDDLSTFIKREQ